MPIVDGDRQDACPTVPAGFSLIEIMVTIGLLSFIILGLLAMFTQTQRAFRIGMTQTDALEAGRSVIEMVTREMEQAAPSRYPDTLVNGTWFRATNFFVELSTNFANPLVQDLPGISALRPTRTNIVQRFFFLTRVNQDWIGTGYQVVFDDPNGYVGTLYRFSMTNRFRSGPIDVSSFFRRDMPVTNLSRIADGVVHFRVRPCAPNGFPVVSDGVRFNAFVRTNALLPTDNTFPYSSVGDALTLPASTAPDRFLGCYFVKSAIPASVEFELGILEPRIVQRYKSIPPGLPAGREYLSSHVAQVHLFRQRVPIRNADLSVFP